MIQVFMHGVSYRSQLGFMTFSIVFCGLYEVWKSRCKIRFEDERVTSAAIIQRIYHHVRDINRIVEPIRKPNTRERTLLGLLHLPVKEIPFRRT